ncbi:MAG: Slp family lipoprotein [Gammaproteobacteria bacterium]|nr:Slp family lipoprotein [Gammaproteobacteria bacterium]
MRIKYLSAFVSFAWLLTALLLPACSSHIPASIKHAPDAAPDITQVRQHADRYLSQTVRWGGVILKTENKKNSSWLSIIALPLNKVGEPQITDNSPGRFIAIIDEFVEPLVYKPERLITVTGQLMRTQALNIGEFSYEYPVIKVDHYYLWPAKPESNVADYPPFWWHDIYSPLYSPYYYPYPFPRKSNLRDP